MSIEIKCPNGHKLKVKDSMAGVTGRCPLCKGVVHVPKPEPPKASLTEDAILDILGPSSVLSERSVTDTIHDFGDSVIMRDSGIHHTPRKACVKCNRDIPAIIHICPYCHTYLPELMDTRTS
jgi:hypothetical protein